MSRSESHLWQLSSRWGARLSLSMFRVFLALVSAAIKKGHTNCVSHKYFFRFKWDTWKKTLKIVAGSWCVLTNGSDYHHIQTMPPLLVGLTLSVATPPILELCEQATTLGCLCYFPATLCYSLEYSRGPLAHHLGKTGELFIGKKNLYMIPLTLRQFLKFQLPCKRSLVRRQEAGLWMAS